MRELGEIQQEEMNLYVKELDYVVSKRKLLEKAGPVGHLVVPIYSKFKTRYKTARTAVAKE